MKISPSVINEYFNNKIGIIFFFLKQKKIILYLLFIISYLFFYFFVDFSSQNLVAHDEGLYARRSRLVEESSNWFSSPFDTPHHKTLGSYWLIALSIRLFGYSETALRLPSIFTSFLCLLTTYFIALIVSNKKSAIISVFSLSSMPLWIQYSRYASPDIPFLLSILLAIFFFLKFIDNKHYNNKKFYIFLSGLFLSTSFFLRSYMSFVPIIGLSPFLIYHLVRSNNIFKKTYALGIFIGLIPTLISLYFSFQVFGIDGITSLFDFAKKQAIDNFEFNNLFLIPLNSLYFTFPIGILFVFLLLFTKSTSKVRYPLLIYYYPIFSLLILLFMSTSYSHYYLFLLPPLSIIFSVKLESFTFKSSSSKRIIKYFILFLMILVSTLLVALYLYYNDYFSQLNYRKTLLVNIVSLFLIISYITSLRIVFADENSNINLIRFLFNLIIPQFISLSFLYNFGIIGNPNFKIKQFLNDSNVSLIVKSNTIYLYNVDSKITTLLSYYLPSSKVIKTLDDINFYDYLITSESTIKDINNKESSFKEIREFDKHIFLMHISK